MKKALLITDESQRYYFEPFLTKSWEKGVEVLMFDPSQFPDTMLINVYLDNLKLSGCILVKKLNGPRQGEYSEIDINEIDVAWYLRPSNPVPRKAQTELDARFSQNECVAALNSVFSTVDWRWVNSREVISFLDSNKLYQQKIAAECGLATPRTLVTNKPKEAFLFSLAQGEVLLKTFGYTDLGDGGDKFIYSEIFSSEELSLRSQGIETCPIFAQEYIDKRYEYRSMVIGKRVLACRIDSQSSDLTRIDWRHYDFERVEHVAAELPRAVQRKLLAFMERVDLRYGAIDLIETLEGDFVFLEVNPSGQWEWISLIAEVPVEESVALMLSEI